MKMNKELTEVEKVVINDNINYLIIVGGIIFLLLVLKHYLYLKKYYELEHGEILSLIRSNLEQLNSLSNSGEP